MATREKLLKATARSLCERGYSGASTTAIAREAGVSQGALFKHFGSRSALMACTIEYLFTGLVEEFREAFAAGRNQEDHLSVALRELWAVFLKPELFAILELYIAARTDESLRFALLPAMAQHRINLIAEARILFPEAAEKNPRFALAVDGLMLAMQGAATSAAVLKQDTLPPEFTTMVKEICRRELEPPYGVFP